MRRHTYILGIMKSLKEARAFAGLTQMELAQRAGVTTQTVCNIEAKRVRVPNVTWRVVARLSDALEVDPRELFAFDDTTAA